MQLEFFHRHPLTKKLVIVTAIKLAGLMALWWLFFSGPSDHDLTPDQVGNAILHPQVRNTTTE